MLRLAMPALAEESLVLMVTWTDWFLAGRYCVQEGDATKAAMGLMAYLMWLIPGFFSIVAIGATALIARWVGARDLDGARKAANQALLVGGILSMLLTAVVWQYGRSFIALMQLRDESAEYALEYLQIITLVIPLIMCSQIGAACLRGAGDTLSGFLIKIVVVLINVIVSTLLVTGWGVIEPIGWKGLAIGTALGYAVGGSVVMIVLYRGRAGLQIQWSQLKPDRVILAKMFRIGLPGGFDVATLMFSQLLFLGLINSLGKAAAAAHGLAVQIEACAYLPGAAFQAAAATMAGQYIGARLPDQASRSILQCLFAGGVIMSIGGLTVFFFGVEIATVFTGDSTHPTTIRVAHLLKIVAVALPSLAVAMIMSGGFRGAGDTQWQFYFTLLGFFAIRIPLAIYLSFDSFTIPIVEWEIHGLNWGVSGAWYAMSTDLILRSVMMLARFFHGGWRKIEI